jgi:hypothetical protein
MYRIGLKLFTILEYNPEITIIQSQRLHPRPQVQAQAVAEHARRAAGCSYQALNCSHILSFITVSPITLIEVFCERLP